MQGVYTFMRWAAVKKSIFGIRWWLMLKDLGMKNKWICRPRLESQ